LHKGIGFPPKLEITNSLNCIRRIHFNNNKAFQFLLTIDARMSSLSKDEVHSFIEPMFPSFKAFRGSRDESEATHPIKTRVMTCERRKQLTKLLHTNKCPRSSHINIIFRNRCKNRNI